MYWGWKKRKEKEYDAKDISMPHAKVNSVSSFDPDTPCASTENIEMGTKQHIEMGSNEGDGLIDTNLTIPLNPSNDIEDKILKMMVNAIDGDNNTTPGGDDLLISDPNYVTPRPPPRRNKPKK